MWYDRKVDKINIFLSGVVTRMTGDSITFVSLFINNNITYHLKYLLKTSNWNISYLVGLIWCIKAKTTQFK